MSKLEPGARLEFIVTGLTKDNLEKVQQSLATLTTQVYACTGCGHEAAAAGKCTACNLDLKTKKELVLLHAVPTVETASIRLTPVASRTLRYSDLESALTKQAIQIDGARFPLVGKSRLMLSGGTLENAKTIEKALVGTAAMRGGNMGRLLARFQGRRCEDPEAAEVLEDGEASLERGIGKPTRRAAESSGGWRTSGCPDGRSRSLQAGGARGEVCGSARKKSERLQPLGTPANPLAKPILSCRPRRGPLDRILEACT